MIAVSKEDVASITRPPPEKPSLWFTAKGERYVEQAERYFFDSSDLPALEPLEAGAEEIVNEYEHVAGKNGHYTPYFQDDFADPPETWHTIPLMVFGVKRPEARFFPVLTKMLDDNPDIIGCFFSRVRPRSRVLPHCGVTNAIFRCHMGIDLPTTDAALTGMQVGPEVTNWHLGKFFAFNDANYHATWNDTDGERVILVVDLLRPEFHGKKFYFYARILVSYFCLKVDERFKWKAFDRFLRSQLCKRLANWFSIPVTPIAWLVVKYSALRSAWALRQPHRAHRAR